MPSKHENPMPCACGYVKYGKAYLQLMCRGSKVLSKLETPVYLPVILRKALLIGASSGAHHNRNRQIPDKSIFKLPVFALRQF